jgi:hypothetical protein
MVLSTVNKSSSTNHRNEDILDRCELMKRGDLESNGWCRAHKKTWNLMDGAEHRVTWYLLDGAEHKKTWYLLDGAEHKETWYTIKGTEKNKTRVLLAGKDCDGVSKNI